MNSTQIWQYFQLLFIPLSWVLQIPFFGCGCLFVIIIAGTLFWRQKPYRKGLWKQSYWLVFTQLLFYPAIMATGWLFELEPPSYLPNSKMQTTGFRIIDSLLFISLALSIFWIWKIKGFRWYISFFLAALQFILCSAWLFAMFSMTGWP
jgi:hypothetical protein